MKKTDRKEITAKDLVAWLKDKRVTCDCGHRHCQHFLSNTLVVTAEGKVYCSECYQ